MLSAAFLDTLETPLDEAPEFFVEGPDKRRDWSEEDRQAEFLRLVHMLGPRVIVWAVPNAGKRGFAAQRKSKREGLVAGVFDIHCAWSKGMAPFSACIEFKGYTKAGRAGELSEAQIRWGNRMFQNGHDVACFFDPIAAANWLRDLGAPIRRAA